MTRRGFAIQKIFDAEPGQRVRLSLAPMGTYQRGGTFAYDVHGESWLAYTTIFVDTGFGGSTPISADRSDRARRDRFQRVGHANPAAGTVWLCPWDVDGEECMAALAASFEAQGWTVQGSVGAWDGQAFTLNRSEQGRHEVKRDRNANLMRSKVAGIDMAAAMAARKG
jgi:hypothetical protein